MATIDEASGRFLLTPEEPEEKGLMRQALHAERGLGAAADPELDAFAANLARAAGMLTGSDTLPYAMVNIIGFGQAQFLAGLYAPEGPDGETPEIGRALDRELGFCVHALDRGKALVLEDVTAVARYATNGVIDGLGVRTYLGAPLIDERTGIPFGTVCVVDTEPRAWGKEGLDLIKASRDQLSRFLDARREQQDREAKRRPPALPGVE